MKNNIDTKLYSYTVFDISNAKETGFRAIIPKFPNLHIFADSPKELHDIVQITIKEEIENLKRKRLPIPRPDITKYSGKFVLRVKPETHERLVHLSKASGSTLNQFLNEVIEKALSK